MFSLLFFAGPPQCRLEESLRRLPPERFCLLAPGDGPLFPQSTIAVFSDLLEHPPKAVLGLVPVDCGLSLRDTLTLSSVTETSAVISLQRPVARLDGSLVEPVEFPLRLGKRWSPYHLLCCGGALLLAGGPKALEESDIF